jgi:DNA-binding transcriptional LysR family regulator
MRPGALGRLELDRSGAPLSPADAGHDFIREAHQILQAAREQTAAIQ